jgi:hypothetical protein
MKKFYSIICPQCGTQKTTPDKRQRYCSKKCAAKQNNSVREPRSPEQRKKVSESLKKHWADHPEKKRRGMVAALDIAKYTRGKYRECPPETILELSKRTVGKIIKRMNIGCSRCNWKEDTCDIHHIYGRKIDNPNKHENLSYLCPNCHRLAQSKKIKPEELISLDNYIGDTWKQFYFG